MFLNYSDIFQLEKIYLVLSYFFTHSWGSLFANVYNSDSKNILITCDNRLAFEANNFFPLVGNLLHE